MPDPACSVNGFGMKDARMPWDTATSFSTTLKVMMLSAMLKASA